jgi:predicted alpha/beta superfamily hydrolase
MYALRPLLPGNLGRVFYTYGGRGSDYTRNNPFINKVTVGSSSSAVGGKSVTQGCNELVAALNTASNQQITLYGHSYGANVVLCALQAMSESSRQKIDRK